MAGKLEESLYPRLPVLLQNAACSYYGWKVSRQRYNAEFYNKLAWLKESQWWGHEKIRAYQDQQVAELYRYAWEQVPYYRETYAAQGLNPDSVNGVQDLDKLPTLDKATVKARRTELQSREFPATDILMQSTSGTTGTPLQVAFTRAGLAFQWAVWWRHKSRFGLKPGDRHLSFTGKSMVPTEQHKPPYWRHDLPGHRVCLSVYHISPGTIEPIAKFLNSTSFDFYTGAASGMYTLADNLEAAGLTLDSKPKMVVSGADRLLPKYQDSMERNFGAPVTEQYGMVEFAANMAKCEAGNYHVDFECGHIEGVPIEGTPYHRLLLTGWGNRAMPFIRYEVGDLGVPIDSACSCGRHSACYASIDGRLEDYVITPDGRRLMGMNQVLQYAEHAKEVQIYQDRLDHVEFRIVPGEGFGDEDINALRKEFSKRAGDGIETSFRVVDTLERAANGKLRAVISDVARGNVS